MPFDMASTVFCELWPGTRQPICLLST